MKYRDPDTGNFTDLYFKTGDTLPIGAIVPYGSTTAPSNWLICDGSAVSRTTYADLFAAIGTSFGTGDGSTTFNLPDLRGKIPVGLKSADTDFDTMGETGGEKTHTLTSAESGMPDHEHSLSMKSGSGGWSTVAMADGSGTTTGYTGKTGSRDAQQAHNNLQPYQVTNYIIKAYQAAGVVANVSNAASDSTTDTYSCDYINDIVEEEYSTTETKTNKVWIDGKPIYRKVISIPLTGTYQESGKFWTWTSDPNIATIDVLITNTIYCEGNSRKINSQADDGLFCTPITTGSHANAWQVGASLTEFDDTSIALLIIEYTKTTD